MKPRLVLLLPLLSLPLAGAAELGRPDMSGEEFNRRLAAGYGVLSEREPKISEVEVAILEKLAPMVTENPRAATNMVQEILAEGKPVTAAFNQVLGNLYLTGGQLEAAESEFRAAIRKFPDFQRAWNSLGILFVEQDRYPEAMNALARSIELGASDAMTYGMLGYSLLRTREYIAAEVAYNMALLRAPGSVQRLEGKMRILAESGRHHEVIAAADELLTRDPANREDWRLQANAHLAMGELDKAARNLEIARILGGIEADALYLLGGIYIKQGMAEQALDAYLAAVKLEPDTKASTQKRSFASRRFMPTPRGPRRRVSTSSGSREMPTTSTEHSSSLRRRPSTRGCSPSLCHPSGARCASTRTPRSKTSTTGSASPRRA